MSHVTQELCLLAVALADLHHDHEEVSSLLPQILDATDNHERGELLREMMSKLLAHAKAEQKAKASPSRSSSPTSSKPRRRQWQT